MELNNRIHRLLHNLYSKKTMKYILLHFALFLIYPLLFAQNILISDINDPNEPSIKIDPKNTDILVAGTNLNNQYRSNDGGLTWTRTTMTSTYGVWGDPVIEVDTNSDFYFLHLSNPPFGTGNWIDRIVCQKSTDQGATWTPGTYTGLNGTKVQDKHWTIVDRTNNNMYVTWTQFDEYDTNDPNKKSNIMFSKSVDAGATWSAAVKINVIDGDCVDSDNTVEGATPAVGPNGEVYVTWAGPNGLVFNRSLDQGTTWLNTEIPISNMPGGWDYTIPGLMRCNGLPVTKCDLSGGPNHGTIYVNWSDQRNGTNNTDIWLAKSVDGGNTWSAPIKVNDDSGNHHQFLTWMDVDQTNGDLFFVFYDRRNYTDAKTDVYLAISQDGGLTFYNRKISESPFTPNTGVFFGDYNNITVHNGIVRPIWTRLQGSNLSIWTDLTPLAQLLLTTPESENISISNEVRQFPNPSSDVSYVSFKLHEFSTVTIEIYDQKGSKVHSVINEKQMEYGKHILTIPLDELNLTSGTYFYKLNINGKVKTLKNLLVVD